jgi:hypothetical protein
MTTFWIVCRDNRVETQLMARKRHATKADAMAEATRLAAAEVGARFLVFEVLGVAEAHLAPVSWNQAIVESEDLR